MKNLLVIFLAIVLFLPSLISGDDFGALQFDGYTNRTDYVDIGNNAVFRFGTGDVTLEAWVKTTTPWSVSIIDATAWDWSKGFALETSNGKFDIFTYDDSTGQEAIATSPNFNQYNDNNWHHVVGTRESNILYLYVDGALVDTDQESSPIDLSHEDNLSIAYSYANNTWFGGSIDEVRIYNRAISEDEVSGHYNGEFNNETGLIGLWHFDELEGNTAYDNSGYENNGTITGAEWVEGVSFASSGSSSMSGVDNADPVIKLETEIIGLYNGILPINYLAFDRDSGKGALKAEPIRLYYSDDRGVTWKKTVSDRPNTGIYNFDTTEVLDGENYKIRLLAFDNYDYFGEIITEVFAIDNTGPSFDISISPSSIREKDTITLKIISSEELKGLLEIKITQAGSEPSIVQVKGDGKEFFGSYYVGRGPGDAVISISGEDSLGNVGEAIDSGKTFFVERFGPPAPTIETVSNNQVFTQEVVNIVGESQPDTEVIITLNGDTKFTVKPSNDKKFSVDVPLSRDNNGYNTLNIIAFNSKGEDSREIVLEVKLNSSPEISMTSSFEGIISDKKQISWISSDANDDELSFSVEYSNDEGDSWDFIAEELSEDSYEMDTTQLADGFNYLLKVTADDKTEKVSALSKKFIIKNNLPHISLDFPSRYFTNINTPVFTGKVTGSERKIKSVKYSFDRGETWYKANASDNRFDSLVEKIKISTSDPLREGKQSILVSAVDTLNRAVKISRSFTIDTISPDNPIIESSILDKAVEDSMDANLILNGLQIVFKGKTEPEARIELVLKDKTYKTIADEKGEFEIKDVTLKTHGLNKFSLSNSDLADNISWTDGTITLNNLPRISFLDIEEGKFLTDKAEINWQVEDLDNDSIVSQILYQNNNEEWISLSKDLTINAYKLDSSKINSGEHKIKIIASDGINEVEEILNLFIDNVSPRIVLNASIPPLSSIVRPTFSGQAFDDFSGIEYIEYSFDNVDWFKALITDGYQSREADFRFRHRFSLKDGEYKVIVRATDRAGNIAYSEPQNLTINVSPPRIGSNLISSGALILFPDKTGAIELFKDRPYKILFSVAKDAKEVILSAKEIILGLKFNKATFLWESEFNFKDAGEYPIEIKAQDELGNSQTKEIALLKVLPWGRVYNKKDDRPIEGARAVLYFFDENTNSWLIWDGQAFNQKNPQKTNEQGKYGFIAPVGKYKLEISKNGFKKVKSKEFEIENNQVINIDIPLIEKEGIFSQILDYFR